jgi:hypothetical protein
MSVVNLVLGRGRWRFGHIGIRRKRLNLGNWNMELLHFLLCAECQRREETLDETPERSIFRVHRDGQARQNDEPSDGPEHPYRKCDHVVLLFENDCLCAGRRVLVRFVAESGIE